jgi:hypothetical protein
MTKIFDVKDEEDGFMLTDTMIKYEETIEVSASAEFGGNSTQKKHKHRSWHSCAGFITRPEGTPGEGWPIVHEPQQDRAFTSRVTNGSGVQIMIHLWVNFICTDVIPMLWKDECGLGKAFTVVALLTGFSKEIRLYLVPCYACQTILENLVLHATPWET